jgi:hypothetical protein
MLIVWLCLSLTGAALAQDLPNLREARGLIFAEDGAIEWEVIPDPALSETDMAIIDQINRIQPQPYYGAMAIAPDAGLEAATTSLAANYHDEANARAAALAACESSRTSGADCIVAMVIRPAGWQPGSALQLSTEAAAALRSDYRRLARRSRAMAISPGTGQWGVGAGREAAIAACGAADCRVVVEG